MPLVGVRAGLSVDHLVDVRLGARFDALGGPGLYAALGASLVQNSSVRLATLLPQRDHRFRQVLAGAGVDLNCSRDVLDVPRVWILNGHQGRRILDAGLARTELEADPGSGTGSGSDQEAVPPEDTSFDAGLDGLLASSPAQPPTGRVVVTGVDPHQLLLAAEGVGYLDRVAPPGSVLLPSRLQLALLGSNVRRCAWRLAAELSRPVIARLDRDGMYATDGRSAWSVQDPVVQVRETTGAGDASAGAIVAALAAGSDLSTGAAFGVSVARLAVSDWGHLGLVGPPPLRDPFDQLHISKEIRP